MGKPNLACFYFQKALQENEAAIKSCPKADSGKLLPLENVKYLLVFSKLS